MRRAILLTGFNNWGKTTHICSLFNRSRFYFGSTYSIAGVNASFTVESHSNDDYSATRYIDVLLERINRSPDNGENLFCPLCPSREAANDSRSILTQLPLSKYGEVYLFYLKFKWDHHAELRIKDIQKHLVGINSIREFVVDADSNLNGDSNRSNAREGQIISKLQQIFP